ncbi:unnamed protein product [Leptosia nina]|uniref:FLYWCH-type domain-containing protein n=1 Tax=Leptosia nina TaxID=320188 RepID=A0AAV1J7C0_9NEOP
MTFDQGLILGRATALGPQRPALPTLITLTGNKQILLYDQHTYSFPSQVKRYGHLYCSRRLRANCKARVKLCKDGVTIVPLVIDHTHPPPFVKRLPSGHYAYFGKVNEDHFLEFRDDYVATMKDKFQKLLDNMVTRKKNSIHYINESRYRDLMAELKEVKASKNKSFEDYKLLSNYDILEVNGKERLIQPKDVDDSIKFYVKTDELFSVLHTIHLLFQHADLDKMGLNIKRSAAGYACFTQSQKGNTMLLFGNYRYSKQIVCKKFIRWVCSTNYSKGCRALIKTTGSSIIETKGYTQQAIFTTSQKGKILLLYNNFTYYKQTECKSFVRWVCSTHLHKGCRAIVKTRSSDIIFIGGCHNHDASELLRNKKYWH